MEWKALLAGGASGFRFARSIRRGNLDRRRLHGGLLRFLVRDLRLQLPYVRMLVPITLLQCVSAGP